MYIYTTFFFQVQRYNKDHYSFDYFFDQAEEKRTEGLIFDSSDSEDEESSEPGMPSNDGEVSASLTTAQSESSTSSTQTSQSNPPPARWVITS